MSEEPLITATVVVILNVNSVETTKPQSLATPESETDLGDASRPNMPHELRAVAITAVATAAQFTGSDPAAQRERVYLGEGFPAALAASFTPVWFEVFNGPNVGRVTIAATGETLISATVDVTEASQIAVESVSGGQGHRVYKVAIEVGCRASWSTGTGNFRSANECFSTWRVTVDEATGSILDIEQPVAAEIPFRPKG